MYRNEMINSKFKFHFKSTIMQTYEIAAGCGTYCPGIATEVGGGAEGGGGGTKTNDYIQ